MNNSISYNTDSVRISSHLYFIRHSECPSDLLSRDETNLVGFFLSSAVFA